MTSTKGLGPDAVFVNAAGIITMEGQAAMDRSLSALAVRDGRIIALGSDDAVQQMADGAPVVDMGQAVVMPGIIDSHNHMLQTAIAWERVQLAHVRDIDELLAAVAQRVSDTPPGEWVLCSNRWHETQLAEQRLPLAQELDRVAPHNPVYLPRGGHVMVTNSLGLQLAGIHHDSQDPPGGRYVRDASGRLTGMLLEHPAFARLLRLLPQPDQAQHEQAIRTAMSAYAKAGITTVREPGLRAAEVQAYQAIVPQTKTLRMSLMWRVELAMTTDERRSWLRGLAAQGSQDAEWLHIWGLKMMMDGGVEGGYFREPYANNPQFYGIPLAPQEQVDAIVNEAQELGWRVGIHVVGDAALEMALNAFERASVSTRGRGHVLEHAFTPLPGAMERVRALGVGITLQHALVYSLAGNMLTYWGRQRAEDCTPSRAWLDSGTVVGAGTDSPVTSFDPWLNVYGFATRDTQLAGVMGPQHRISVAEALRAYTAGSAAILGSSAWLGTLAPGKAADFICLDRDPLAAAPDEARQTVVRRTIVNGRQVYPA